MSKDHPVTAGRSLLRVENDICVCVRVCGYVYDTFTRRMGVRGYMHVHPCVCTCVCMRVDKCLLEGGIVSPGNPDVSGQNEPFLMRMTSTKSL